MKRLTALSIHRSSTILAATTSGKCDDDVMNAKCDESEGMGEDTL
jgi:hypothetical protein